MTQSHYRWVGLASVLLVSISSFAACGGLDPRKVTRGPDYSAGGDENTGNAPNAGGGSDSGGGEPSVNPFGGNFDLGGAPPVVDGPPEVVKVDPEDAATDVDVNTNVSFLFNEAINPGTVSDETVQLLDGATPVDGKVTLNQDVIGTFEPSRRLALATTYTTSVSSDVTDTTGQALAAPFTSSFTTRDGQWEVDDPFVENPGMEWNYYTSTADVAVDARGNVLVIWAQSDGLNARWYRQATGWQAPVVLSTANANLTEHHSVAVSPDGEAFVVWAELAATNDRYDIMARRFVGGAWRDAPEIATGEVSIPQSPNAGPFVAIQGGRALVWWQHVTDSTESYYYIYAQTATIDGPWLTNAAYIDYAHSASNSLGRYMPLGMDSSGNAMLVYNKVSSANNLGQLHYAKFIAATADWEQSAPITGATGVGYSSAFGVALDNTGAAAVVWPTSGPAFDLVASRYTKAKGFTMPVPLDDLDTPASVDARNGIVTDGTDFVVSWAQTVGSTNNVYSSRYSTAEGVWLPGVLVSDGDTGINGRPRTVADEHGNCLILWTQASASSAVSNEDTEFRFSRWRAGSSAWAASGLIADGKNYDHNLFAAAPAASNGTIALVTQDIGNYVDRPGEPFLNIFR
jgi:hypothetical protein